MFGYRRMIKIFWGVAVFVLVVFLSGNLVRGSVPLLKEFFVNKGDLDRQHLSYRSTFLAYHAKRIIPPQACVWTSFDKDEVTMPAIAFKYQFYPLRVLDNWPHLYNQQQHACRAGRFFVDLDQRGPPRGVKAPFVDIGQNGRVYALDESSRFVVRSEEEPFDLAKTWSVLVYQFVVLLLGSLLIFVMPIRTKLFSYAGFLGTSYLLGMTLVTLSMWGGLLVGVELDLFSTALLLSILIIFHLVLVMRKYCKGEGIYFSFRCSDQALSSWGVVNAFILGALILVLLIYGLKTLTLPVVVWDEMHIWLLKSKMFFFSHGLDFSYTVDTNNYYPILWSLFIAMQYAFTGHVHDMLAKLPAMLVFLSAIGVFYDIARVMGMRAYQARLALIVFMVGFPYWTYFTALTENVYIAMMALSFYMIYQVYILKKEGCSILLFLSLMGAALVKFEGAILALFFFIAVLTNGQWRCCELLGKFKRTWSLLLILLLPFLWKAWLTSHSIPFSVYHLKGRPSFDNVIEILKMAATVLFQWPNIMVLMLAVSGVVIFRSGFRVESEGERFLDTFCVLLVLFSFSAGVCWPRQDLILYYPEVLTRLFSRVAPFLVIMWFQRIFRSVDKEKN